MPEGTKPIHISIVGSRAKGYNQENSDYQIRIIGIASQQAYDSSSERRNFSIKTSFKGRAVECIGVDVKLSLI